MKRNKYLLNFLRALIASLALSLPLAACSSTGFSSVVNNPDAELEDAENEEAVSETQENFETAEEPNDGDSEQSVDQNCAEGGRMCALKLAYECKNGEWVKILDCAVFGAECLNGNCAGGDYEPADFPELDAETEADSLAEEQAQCSMGEKRCIGNIVYICNQQGNFDAQMDCGSVGKTCSNGTCYGGGDVDPDTDPELADVDTAACSQGETKCVSTTVFRCDSTGSWSSVENCAASGKNCVNGACVGGGDVDADADSNPGGLCPSGQVCVQGSPQSGVTVCLTGGSTPNIPPENKTGCDASSATSCPHNQWCVTVGATNYCIQLCGTCPSGQTCVTSMQINYCAENGQIPSNAQRGCSASQPCSGNANCYCTESSCNQANNVCLFNCSG